MNDKDKTPTFTWRDDMPKSREQIEMQERINAATLELVEKHNIAVEQLTAQQIADALKQAIACGDFVRYVRLGHPSAQSVIYAPYAEVERLRSRIARLESVLEANDLLKEANEE